MTKFSVLISVYIKETPLFLKEALKSIWDDQTLKPNEIVIVKDGKLNEELEQVLDEFSNKAPTTFVSLDKNLGLGLALREGIKHCSFDYVARMDSDDIAYPYRFEKQINYLEKKPEISILGSYIDEFINYIDNVKSVRKVPEKHQDIIKMLKGRCPLSHPSVIFKKEAVINSGNYQPFLLKEDIYLWLRMYSNNYIFANIPESLLYFRITKDTYKRRGGYKYAKSEFRILFYRYSIGLINFFELIKFILLTIPVRLVPSFMRNFIYTKLLR